MKTQIYVLLILLLAGSGMKAPDALPPYVTKVAPGVWFREGVPNYQPTERKTEIGNPNCTIIEMKDYLIVVDASFPSGARILMDVVKQLSNKPVKYVFNTHHHGDHSYGNVIWTHAGATTLAYAGVMEEQKRYEPGEWQALVKTRLDVAGLNMTGPEPPMVTFTESPYIIDDGNRVVEFHHLGWAHTRGDGFVFLPKEKIICTGDALANGGINYLGPSNIQNWNNVLTKAKALGAKHVLPGHGPRGGPELFDGQMLFFTELIKAVQKEIDNGKKIEDLVYKLPNPTIDGPKSGTTIVLPKTVQHWVGPHRLPLQVTYVYEELTQKKPHGEIMGGK